MKTIEAYVSKVDLPQLGFVHLPSPEQHATRENATEFCPGDKVICVNARGLTPGKYSPPLVEQRLYCVREVFSDVNGPGICVVGIAGLKNAWGLEWGFMAKRFRLVTRS